MLLTCLVFSITKDKSTDNPHSLASMGRRKFLLQKCSAECGEKGGAIVVTSLVPRVSWKVLALPPSSVAVFVSSNSPILCRVCVCVCVCVCVSGPLRALDHIVF